MLRLIVAGVLLFVVHGVAWPQVPLPADLSIHPPDAGVPAADAAFLGAWGNGAWGAWYGLVPTALVVEQVNADGSAKVIYARGTTDRPKIVAHWVRLTGRIQDHRLVIHLPDPNSSVGLLIEYQIMAPGNLEGESTNWEGYRGHVFLQRIAGPPAAIVATAAQPLIPVWHEITIPEHSSVGAAAGQTIQLSAAVYRVRLPGRQPLVVLNHGAASPRGEDAVRATLYYESAASFFLAHGYSVVVPMRKGRGKSGGPYLEDSTGTQVDSAVEDEDTVVNAMCAEPWVDPARIILAGWSRGGFLSVIYAGRHPDKVAGVISFSGGWWGQSALGSRLEEVRSLVAAAAKTTRIPELWLYADNDSSFPLPYARKMFDTFRANGGTGDLLTFGKVHAESPSAVGEGHTLFEHVGMWKTAVAAYLLRIDDG